MIVIIISIAGLGICLGFACFELSQQKKEHLSYQIKAAEEIKCLKEYNLGLNKRIDGCYERIWKMENPPKYKKGDKVKGAVVINAYVQYFNGSPTEWKYVIEPIKKTKTDL